ncbi:MAG TPA: LysR family transcriptional regulator [Spongiibacteraceae bacterium]|nr:LysR family transcriptional regulator [Spongiibacteraceae bacterium]HCS29259.1 LysR family transcriptional regulator [Spongiibacteraceae bacterium]
MRYSFRQLEVFLAAAHFDNISRAAEHLAMSQSAASGALKELEQQFDVQLFDRVGKRLQINELGRVLRPQAEALLEQARALEQALAQHSQIGQIKVGATLTIGNYLAVGIVARYMAEQPAARVSLEVANTESIAAKVLDFELDIGLIEGEYHHPDLDILPWRDDELAVFCSPNHPLAGKQRISDADLLAQKWILRESGSGTRQAFERAFHGLLPQLTIALELQHTEAIKRAVEADLGIGCLSAITLEEAVRHQRLVKLELPEKDFRRHFYFVLHKQKYRSAGIQRWLELCQQS